jgi:hypothetical protein
LERIDRVLAVRADNTPRRLAVVRHLLPIARDPAHSILYFGPSARDAECMPFLLRRADLPAAVVSGTTRDVTRRQVVTEIKQKKVRVLCNCEVLTTGFDALQVTHVPRRDSAVGRKLAQLGALRRSLPRTARWHRASRYGTSQSSNRSPGTFW